MVNYSDTKNIGMKKTKKNNKSKTKSKSSSKTNSKNINKKSKARNRKLTRALKKDDVNSYKLRDSLLNSSRLDGDNNNLNTNDLFRLLDLYFYKEFYTYRHLHNNFDKLIDDTIPKFFYEVPHVFSEQITEDKLIKHKFIFENVRPEPPKLSNKVDPMFPADARHLGLTYAMTIYADMTQVKEVIDINSTSKESVKTEIVGHTEKDRPIMIIPVMVRSKYCNLNIYPNETRDECKYDPGGYFIVNGSEKVVISQDRMLHNVPMVFVKKNSNIPYNVVQVNSKSPKPNGMMQTITIKMKKDNIMIVKVPIFHEINVMILFRALGIESDKDIIDICTYDSTDYHMIDLVRFSLDNCVNDNDERNIKIQTQEEAIDYLIGKMRVVKKYTETSHVTKLEQKKIHLMELLKTNLFPHVIGTSNNPYYEKAYFLGHTINRLLKVELGRESVDNRDSYTKKRVDSIKELLEEIAIQQYKNNIAECNKQFIARMADTDINDTPYNIIFQFKASTFEQGFKASLMLGNWPRKKGVSQMLQRMSYMQLLTYLSRIDSQSGSQSSSKLTKPRQIDPSSVPFLCVTGNTEVLHANGSNISLIKDMQDGDYIRSVNKNNLNEIKTPIYNYFSRKADDIIEIETISGRKISCTKDHPLLTRRNNRYIMCNAGDLKINDEVIVRHMVKYIDIDKEDTLNINDKTITQEELELTARIMGFSVLNNQDVFDNGCYVLNNKSDALALYDDIIKLGYNKCEIKKYDFNKYIIICDDTFLKYLCKMFLYAIENGTGLPKWISEGNNRIKREFLSGFSSRYCSSLNIINDNIKPININVSAFEYINNNDYGPYTFKKTNQFIHQIKWLYENIGISVSEIKNEIKNEITNIKYGKKLSRKCSRYTFEIENTYDNVSKFADLIDYSYSIVKRKISSPVIEYVKYINNNDNNENLTNYDDFVIKYFIKNRKLAIPIKSIKNVENQIVYDFTTKSSSHTFIANGFVVSNCVVQTPEHAKIGLIKHLSMIGSITIGDRDNTELVREYILTCPDVQSVTKVPIYKMKRMYKIFLNGEWLGMIDNIYNVGDVYTANPILKFYSEAKVKKITGAFNPQMTSIALDHKECEIRFCTDSGRLYRPVLRVNGNNEVILTKKMLDTISLRKTDKDKITNWDEFYMQEPYPIEFIDSEEQPYMMIAEDIRQLNYERKKIIETEKFKFKGDTSKIINRYDDKFFNRFDAVEIHQSVLLGEIVTNIPFCNHNQAPRNIFQYAQGKQGMGIYCTTYRSRTDISYILYNPEVPVVNTRTSKYTYTDVLPPGSNAVVAIACYSGYNQEDSLVFNKTSLQRGLFRSMSLKKYTTSITKNQETSGDDKFMKPPPDKTLGIKNGQYDKMNEKGFIPEETNITNGDMIFGKVTPISDITGSDKIFKDSSEQYKSHADGVVDKVYTGIKNQDGYETRKALIRSEREPHIGDKFCSRHGQKGTMGIGMVGIDCPFTKHGIRPDIIMNPHAVPSRMTIGQLIECIIGKEGALKGMNVDGTAFEEYDIESVKDMLEKNGYHREGLEYLYNGMTGKRILHMIFIGPTFYQRLKHMVLDKIHARSRGPTTILTRQAPEGRAREGGLRLGEMERDALVAHGMAKLLKEKLMDCSDAYSTYVCGQCGLFARREESRHNQDRPGPEDVYYCHKCKNYNDIHKIMIPYAFKLMIQELMAMCIAPRIRVQKNLRV